MTASDVVREVMAAYARLDKGLDEACKVVPLLDRMVDEVEVMVDDLVTLSVRRDLDELTLPVLLIRGILFPMGTWMLADETRQRCLDLLIRLRRINSLRG